MAESDNGPVKQVRIPLPTSSAVDTFMGASLHFHQMMQNAMIEIYPEGLEANQPFVTQRPGFDVIIDASEQGISSQEGRGIYYWTETDATYLAHYNTIYKNTYETGSVVGTTNSAEDPCSFAELGSKLVINTPHDASHGLWMLDSSDTLTEVSDTDAPTSLASGIVSMDGFIFVMGENGRIYNSAEDDPSTWNAIDVAEAERDSDGGVALIRHHNNIVALGTRTIEFFYNNANPVGSPLSRREDLFFNIGCAHGPSVWSDGELCFFIGITSTGGAGIYVLENWQIRKVSTASIDSYLTTMLLREGLILRAACLSGHGHLFYLISTGIETDVGFYSKASIVYDHTSGFWSSWKSSLPSLAILESLPLVGNTVFYGDLTVAQAQLINGDVVAMSDNLNPFDTLRGDAYFTKDADFVDSDYVVSLDQSGTNIEMIIESAFFDGGTDIWKIGTEMNIVAERTKAQQNILIRWSDNNNESYNSGRTYDLSKNNKLTRLGRFVRRSFQIVAVLTEQVRLYAMELKFRIGRNL